MHNYYNVSIKNFADNGAEIKDILEALPNALAYNPDGVILFWDSDVSNVDERFMPPDKVAETRRNFTINLNTVVNDVLASGAFMTG